MISNRSDAFEDVVAQEEELQRDRYYFARALLEEQTAELIEGGLPLEGEEPLEARHSPHNPHWRGLSSAARRLVRAEEHLAEAIED